MKHIFKTFLRAKTKGFILPLTLVICVITLTISSGISLILVKEVYFSKVSRLSHVAYYAADDGMQCASTIDDLYIDPDTGLGIFESNASVEASDVLDRVNTARASNGLPAIALTDIKCATASIFDAGVSGYDVIDYSRINSEGQLETGRSTSFNMIMDLGNGTSRCALVTINKTSSYRQIISRGFATCSPTSAYSMERAVINVTEVQ